MLSRSILLLWVCWLAVTGSHADVPYHISRLLTVREGLPQSYISGTFQDRQGFLWVATLNGLGRYDGREFRIYQHTTADTSGISDNIILNMVGTGNDEILLCYMDGRMDLFNTVSEKVTRLWKNRSFEAVKKNCTNFKSVISDGKGKCWILAADNGVYEMDLAGLTVKHFFVTDINHREPVIGIAWCNDKLLLLTGTKLFYRDGHADTMQSEPYPFGSIAKFKTGPSTVYSPVIRKNGELIIADAAGLKIWRPGSARFVSIAMPRKHEFGKPVGELDMQGNYFLEHDTAIYRLGADNSLLKLLPPDTLTKELPTCIYIDRSGVLWVGTNGFGLWQHTFSKTGLPGYRNRYSFVRDVLTSKGYPSSAVNATFLFSSIPYANRSLLINDSLWISDIYNLEHDLHLAVCANGAVSVKTFRNDEPKQAGNNIRVRAIAQGGNGSIWGIDDHSRLIGFDRNRLTYHIYGLVSIDPAEEMTGMITDDNINFYFSSDKSFTSFNRQTGKTANLTNTLPGKEILAICFDRFNKDLVWAGTLSDGLIRFNKKTNESRVYNTSTGLPNNTIYSILPAKDGLIWSSSNKGIFALDPRDRNIRSFTSRDGLTDDEFNRFYYMQLPGGEMAFGGPLGYTIFDPAKLENDVFDPQVVVTTLNIANLTIRSTPVNAIDELHLRYDQNFITATFAAMQFDFPEKLRYRYMLEGLDKEWIMLGNGNKVSYTSLPPGDYMLKLGATNTAGKWSRHGKQIHIVIAPPFWRTWWFYLLVVMAAVGLVYTFLIIRIEGIRKTQRRELAFERKSMELHALALRAQMNPHFIFNSLNSIKALIQEKQNRDAVAYLTTFSSLIRKQLNNKKNEVSLQEELETCKLYLQLEAMRFEGRIRFKFDIADDDDLLQLQVPPLALQPLVENAIIHGLLPAEQGGCVTVKVYRYQNQCICEIEDNGIGRAASQAGKGNDHRLHQSQGIRLLEERINLHNRLNALSSMETIDLFDTDKKPAGTLVILKFNLQL